LPVLLCDLDNTLVDRDAAFRRWAVLIAARHHQSDDFVDWLVQADDSGYGPRDELFDGFRAWLGLEEADYATDEYYRDFLPQFRTDDDVRAALVEARARGWRIAVVTNGPATQHDKIHHAGLEPFVDTWCVSDVDGHAKPDARLLEIAADRAGDTLDGAWMIGDNADTDIGAAAAAGIDSVWLRQGRAWPREDLAPTLEADSFPEAVAMVLQRASA
jgi:putative hydrolase of the HAD superfamily